MKKKTSSQQKSTNSKKINPLSIARACDAVSVSSLKPTPAREPSGSKKSQLKNNAPPTTKSYKSPLDDIELTNEEDELMNGYSDEHKRFLKLIAEIVVANVLENNGRSNSTQVERDAKAKNSKKRKKGTGGI